MESAHLKPALLVSVFVSISLAILFTAFISFQWAVCFLFFGLFNTFNVYLLSLLLTPAFLKRGIVKKVLIFVLKMLLLCALICFYYFFLPFNVFAFIAGMNIVFLVIGIAVFLFGLSGKSHAKLQKFNDTGGR